MLKKVKVHQKVVRKGNRVDVYDSNTLTLCT